MFSSHTCVFTCLFTRLSVHLSVWGRWCVCRTPPGDHKKWYKSNTPYVLRDTGACAVWLIAKTKMLTAGSLRRFLRLLLRINSERCGGTNQVNQEQVVTDSVMHEDAQTGEWVAGTWSSAAWLCVQSFYSFCFNVRVCGCRSWFVCSVYASMFPAPAAVFLVVDDVCCTQSLRCARGLWKVTSVWGSSWSFIVSEFVFICWIFPKCFGLALFLFFNSII